MRLNQRKLRDLAYCKELTQKEISEATMLSRLTISGIFNGRSTTQETAQKIADVLGVTLNSITVRGEK